MDLRACARCASLDLHGQTLGEGLAVGMEGMSSVCAECGFQGAPLLFAREEDYRDFREAQRGPPGAERTAREAAADADEGAEASAAAASHEPLPSQLASPLAAFHWPVVPGLVFAAGAVSFGLGLFQGAAGLPWLLIGAGFMLVAWRIAHKQRAA